MKFKKSLISLILAAAMLIGTACSQTAETPDVTTTSSGAVTEESQSSTETTSNTEAASITTEKAPDTTPEETAPEETEKENAESQTEAETTPDTETTEKEKETQEETMATETETETETEAPTITAVTAAATTTATHETTTATETAATTTTEAATAAETSAAQTAQPAASGKTVKINALSLPSHVENIVNSMGAGWNLGNQLEASISGVPSETAWGNPVITEELIKTVKSQGFKTVRIPVSYLLKIGSAPDYKIEDTWLKRVKEVVDYVVNNDMYAVINMHGDGYYTVNSSWLLCAEDEEKQKEIREKYKAVWQQIAELFKDYDEHLIFESMNEEFDNTYDSINTTYYENINVYNQIFVDTVRATGSGNANRWLLIPGWNTNIDATVSNSFRLPTDSASNRLMVSVHYYDPYNFALNESSTTYKWGNDAPKGKKTNWGHEDYVEQQFQKLYDTFTAKGVPVIIGEFGAIDKRWSDEGSYEYRRYFFEYVAKSAVNHGCIPVYWDNGYDGKNGFALFDRKNKSVLYPELVEAIVRGATRNGYEIVVPNLE